MSEFGPCAHCPSQAWVKLNGRPLCLAHFNAEMERIGDTTRMIVSQLVDPEQ